MAFSRIWVSGQTRKRTANTNNKQQGVPKIQIGKIGGWEASMSISSQAQTRTQYASGFSLSDVEALVGSPDVGLLQTPDSCL